MAQNYMRLARSHETLDGEDAKRVAHLSVRSALQALSSPRSAVGSVSDRTTVHFSSECDQWNTPKFILDRAVELLGAIDLDPCSNDADHPNVPASRHYTAEDNGLAHEWTGRVFMNPPYGRDIHEWVGRLGENHQRGSVPEALALVPARTDARWFSSLRSYPRCFISGRLKFGDAQNSAPFPSAIFYLGPRVERFGDSFNGLGDVFALWTPR